MLCPDCEIELTKLTVAGVELDTCGECGGAWLDHGELNKLMQFGDADIERQSVDREGHTDSKDGRQCPRCASAEMIKISFIDYPGIILDYCGGCQGIWLDSGELFKIEQQLEPPAQRVEPPDRERLMAFLDSLIPVVRKNRSS